jgi:hypothetical protein
MGGGGLLGGLTQVLFGSSKTPRIEQPAQAGHNTAAEVQATATQAPDNSAALAAAEERRKRRAETSGGTILTSPLGAAGAATQKKTLLG